MRLIDEKGRLFGKINIFDLIVILAVVLVVGGVGYKLIERKKEQSGQIQTKTYIATVKCSAMPDSFAEALLKDTRLYYDIDGFVNAKIIDVKEVPASITVETGDGRLVEAESPTLKDVYVSIQIQDKVSEADIRIGRYAVCVGGKLTVKTVYAMGMEGQVIDIVEK